MREGEPPRRRSLRRPLRPRRPLSRLLELLLPLICPLRHLGGGCALGGEEIFELLLLQRQRLRRATLRRRPGRVGERANGRRQRAHVPRGVRVVGSEPFRQPGTLRGLRSPLSLDDLHACLMSALGVRCRCAQLVLVHRLRQRQHGAILAGRQQVRQRQCGHACMLDGRPACSELLALASEACPQTAYRRAQRA